MLRKGLSQAQKSWQKAKEAQKSKLRTGLGEKLGEAQEMVWEAQIAQFWSGKGKNGRKWSGKSKPRKGSGAV